MKRFVNLLKFFVIIFAISFAFSCTILGKPIESIFSKYDNIEYYNCIGMLSYGISHWEYRICQSNTDKTDICIDGTMKNFFNKTTVDLTFDDITIKGDIIYKNEVIGTHIIFALNDGKIGGEVRTKGDDENWDLTIYDKKLTGVKHTVRFDSTMNFKYGDEDLIASTDDVFMGVQLNFKFGERKLSGKIKNVRSKTKYLLNSDDLTESDMMAFMVIDIVRILRDMENHRR